MNDGGEVQFVDDLEMFHQSVEMQHFQRMGDGRVPTEEDNFEEARSSD